VYIFYVGAKALTFYNNKILLVLRDNFAYIDEPNKWSLPGGGMENSETFEETLKREFYEELSVMPKHLLFLTEYNSPHTEPMALFIVTLNKNEFEHLKLGKEGQKFKFFSLEEVEKLDLVIGLKDLLSHQKYAFKKLFKKDYKYFVNTANLYLDKL